MKLRKGKWEYLLPQETYQLLYAHLCMKDIRFNLCFVTPKEIIAMRHDSMEKNNGQVLQGNIYYVAMAQENGKNFLLVYPDPYKAAELKIQATKIFEI
jgi:hypothetical protein